MKPKRILLIRHGESEGNVNKEIYAAKPDYQLNLTDKGIIQAQEAGVKLKEIIGDERVQFYVSPLWRTRETFQNIIKTIPRERFDYIEDPRLREQEWGHMRTIEESNRINDERDSYGTFYYRVPNGESGADVYDRASTFFETLHRDFNKIDFPDNCVLVTHGMAIRLFLMKWFHLTVEQFEVIRNPKNCEIFILEKNLKNKYSLITPYTEYDYSNLPDYKARNHRPLVI